MNTQSSNQFSMLTKKRFAPLFFTQFLGAFNDNVYKNVLMLMIAYQSFSSITAGTDLLINAAAGLFILPFFLFSALAGQVADKYEKSGLIRWIKLFEILIMTGAAAAIYFNNLIAMLLLLFLMGTQSTFFGPVKYSILPQHLNPGEMVGGNALIEMGTFVAILLGTITGGLLIQSHLTLFAGPVVCAVAVAGWLAGRKIPKAKSLSPNLKISFNLIGQTRQTLKTARQSKPVFLSIIAVSWFWFLGAAYITQFPRFTRDVLHGPESVVTLLLACFSIGIGLGSLLCERLSGKKVELGLVPLGAIGMTIFGIDLCFAGSPSNTRALLTLAQFIHSPGSWHVIADLLLIGVFGGFYTVPLYTYIQKKSPVSKRARVIAANNIVNAFLMVLSAVFGMVLLGVFKMDILVFFFILAVLNLLVAGYIFSVVPQFFIRFMVWSISRIMYRVRVHGASNIPEKGAAVLVCNHVSFVDWMLLSAACRRPIRFVMYAPIYRIPVLHLFFKCVQAIPIDSQKKNPAVYRSAFLQIQQALENHELVCIFPEGKLTRDGKIDAFKGGIRKIISSSRVPVVPMAIDGMWGSFFSHKNGRALRSFPRRVLARVNLWIGSPLRPDGLTPEELRGQVAALNKINSL